MPQQSDQPEISAKALKDAMREAAFSRLPTAALYIGLVYGVLAALHAVGLAPAIAGTMAATSLATCAFLLALSVAARRRPRWVRNAYPLWAGIGLLAISNTLVFLLLVGKPSASTNLILVVVGIGVLVPSARWVAMDYAIAISGWLLIWNQAPPAPEWSEFGMVMVKAVLLGGVCHVLLSRSRRREQMLHLQDVHRVGQLVLMRDQAKKALAIRSEFLANMSHEVRTPMNAVLGLASLLEDTGLTEEQQGYVSTISRSGDSLLAILNDILDLSRIEAGGLAMEANPFWPVECARETAALFLGCATQKGLELSVDIGPGVPRVMIGDGARIQQVLGNLLSNAIKFTDAGSVSIRLLAPVPQKGRQTLQYAVTDSGIGISSLAMDGLFQPFTQADSSITRKFGGTGLGLTISRKLAKMMGGNVLATSEVGVGSTFTLTVTALETTAPRDGSAPS